MNSKPSARLHVILARQAPLAVVIRRGPAKQAGWQFQETLDASGGKVRLREKPLPRGWVLRLIGGTGYELKQVRSGHVRPFPTWEWAELDGKRLVWGERGSLFAAALDRENGIGTPTLVHDFNDMKFEARPAPY